jgi:hypothetical protein
VSAFGARLICVGVLAFAMHAQAEFRVATFEVDVTAPIGHALMGGGIAPANEVVDSLFAKGIVLLGPDAPIVWVAVDWCEIRNDAYDAWRDALAEAAGTTRERVLLAAVHQHDTPIADFTAQRLLDDVGLEESLCDVAFVRACIARSAEALRAAIVHAQTVTHYGVGAAEVREIASNRRVVSTDGIAGFPRNSSTPDPAMHAAPVGLIDPMLRTLSFWNGDKPVAAMSNYAVHPMSYYGKGGVSFDFVGMAREQMEESLLGATYLYFSGCSGDVVAGKYNDGSAARRAELAGKLHDAMRKAWGATARFPLQNALFRAEKVELPLRETAGFTEADERAILADASAKTFNRNLAAMGLSWRAAREAGRSVHLYAVDFGEAVFVQMPAESFVEYQLIAQRLRPKAQVLVAGYGESAPGYIPSASAVGEHFIENHEWCWVGPDAPAVMHDALTRLLAD